MSLFQDRAHAGRVLAGRLGRYAGRQDVRVLALPRGGVPVGFEVARQLGVPLDVFVVRKLGVPGHEELAMGALATGGVVVLNEEVLHELGLSMTDVREAARREQDELLRRERLYRGSRGPVDVEGRTVLLVDDGLATGSTMRAAVASLRRRAPARIVVAVPVAAAETCDALSEEVDEIVCATTPEPFYSVGSWYADFTQTTDDEVRACLESTTPAAGASP